MRESDQVFLKTLILLPASASQLNLARLVTVFREVLDDLLRGDESVAVAAGAAGVCCLQRGAEAGLDDFVHGDGAAGVVD